MKSIVNSGHIGDIGGGIGPWRPPIPLDEIEVLQFPTDLLPTWARSWVAAQAEATQTPPDLAGFSVLGVLAAALAKKYAVGVRPAWSEPLNIMLVVALPPGNRKSAVFSAATAPIYEYENVHREEWTAAFEQSSTLYNVAEKALRKAEESAAKADGPEAQDAKGRALDLARDLAAMKRPVFPRIVADDATPEKIASLLAEQDGRLAIFSAEGGIFTILSGRYSESVPVLDAVLKGHCGDPIRVDRMGRPSEQVDAPALTMCLAVQPAVIRDLSETRAFVERGLVARFLFAVPVSTVGHRRVDPPPVPEALGEEYNRIVAGLLALPLRRDEQGEVRPRTLSLSPLAEAVLVDFMRELEPRLHPEGDLGPLAGWGEKLSGALARIAGLLHAADHAGHETIPTEITDEVMQRAVGFAEYLISHARAAHRLLGGDSTALAGKVLRWIKRRGVAEFTKRECQQNFKSQLRKADELDGPLALLRDHGYIRPAPEEQDRGRGRPSERFEVNPLCQNPQ
jgi:hypothetical protein